MNETLRLYALSLRQSHEYRERMENGYVRAVVYATNNMHAAEDAGDYIKAIFWAEALGRVHRAESRKVERKRQRRDDT